MKRIQIAIPDVKFKKAKAKLTAEGLTWQKWGEAQINCILSESVDDWGIPLLEMAVDKDGFKTKIQEKLIGALREQAFILIAKKNNQEQWVQHKETEVERLLLELVDVFDYETKGKWNKMKAATEAIEYYRNRLKTFITKAENAYIRYYKSQAQSPITEDELVSFLDHVLSILPKE